MTHGTICRLIGQFVLLTSICLSAAYSQETLPAATAGEIPLYPPLARSAHIQGEVTLRVATDGEKVVSVTVVDGQPMLAKSAQDNVRTWVFTKHDPTSFVTRFTFRLLPDCESKNENGNVVLNLPTEVSISVPPRISQCGESYGLDLSEPLKVFLTSCEVDGVPFSCEKVSIQLDSSGLTAKPDSRTEIGGKMDFVVPKEFRSVKTFDVSVSTPKGSFSLPAIDASFLKGKWRIVIDHKPFQEENRYMTKGQACIGFVHFEWSEPERMITAPCK